MFKKILAGLGIDGAKVNFEIDSDVVELGGVVSGKVYVAGGAIDQEIEEITISLEVTSRYKVEDTVRHLHTEIAGGKVADKMFVKANAPEIVIPLQFKLPYNIPITSGATKYHFKTNLDIRNALDAKDIDEITVRPNRPVLILFDALSLLGFRSKPSFGDFNGRFQKFEFTPTSFLRGKLDELELYMETYEDRIIVMLQIDKKAKGLYAKLADDLDLDERYVNLTLPYAQITNPQQVSERLKDIIEREYNKIAW